MRQTPNDQLPKIFPLITDIAFSFLLNFFSSHFLLLKNMKVKKKVLTVDVFFIMSKKNKHPVIFYTLHICLIFFEG